MDNKVLKSVIREMKREITEQNNIIKKLQHEQKEKVANLRRLIIELESKNFDIED